MSKNIVDQSYLLINMINLLGKIKPSMGLEPCKQIPRSMHEILFTHILIFGERGISFLPIKFLNSKYILLPKCTYALVKMNGHLTNQAYWSSFTPHAVRDSHH